MSTECNGIAYSVFVTTPGRKHFCFNFLAIRANSEQELLIEREFYLGGGVLPDFPHHEILWRKGGRYNGMPLTDMHLHASKKTGDYFNSHFLCFTGRIATFADVEKILSQWGVGTAYRFETGEDMNDAIKRLGGIEAFVADCKKKGYHCGVY